MISLAGLVAISSLPFHILATIIKYYLGLTKFKKYEKRLKLCIKLTIYKQALAVPIKDTKYIPTASIDLVLKLLKLKYPAVVKSLSHYGERYGSSGIWIHKEGSRSTSDPVIVYLHGGGYFMKTQPEQIKSLIGAYKLTDPSKKVSILYLDYDLVCEGYKFPRQLRQLDSLYTQLVEDGNENLVFLGDSAGGHLAVTYTEFIRLKKPYLPYPNKLILISPWVNMAVDERDYKPGLSYYDSQHRDMIGYDLFSKPDAGLMFIENENMINHSYFDWAYRLPVDWKKNPFFTNPDNEIFIVYGEHESFRDDIDTWLHQIYQLPKIPYGTSNGKQLPEFAFTAQEESKPKLTAYVEPLGVHDAFFFFEDDIVNKYKEFEQLSDEQFFASKRLVKFLNDKL